MKKSITIACVAIAAIVCVLYSCSKDIKENIKGSIVGTVNDDTTGEPISVAKVLLSPGNASTVTGDDGFFSFKELDAGNYTIEITKTSYKPKETEFVVLEGKQTDAHILLERIPAIITTDKDSLGFGENNSVTSLSFNIVNKSYKALDWSVDCTCSWVSSIEPKTSGKLDYGKTATLIVKIDRNKLESGYNESYLVVFSEEGSVEVKLSAIGAETAKPTINILEASDITSNSMRFNAEITSAGIPEYFERGFVYGVTENPTIDNVVLTAPIDGKVFFSCLAENLNLGTAYYVRAYAKNKIRGEDVVTYSVNSITASTKTSAPKVSISNVSDLNIEKKHATLNAVIDYVGDPFYTEKGFVYGTSNNPTIENDATQLIVEGVTSGAYSAVATNLHHDLTYYVRAYVINDAGIVYSDEEVDFKLETTLPKVETGAVTSLDVVDLKATLNATITDLGMPNYKTKGFVYGTTNNPTIESGATQLVVEGVTSGAYSAVATNLQRDVAYYVRAYVTNDAGTVYGEDVEFELETTLPKVETGAVTSLNVVDLKATLNATITDLGMPNYKTKGFVYGTTNNPTIESGATQLVVEGVTSGAYSAVATNLQRDVAYYVRAYVISESGTIYSENSEMFALRIIDPKVSMMGYDEPNLQRKSARLKGSVSHVGDPSYTEKGFVYSDSPLPTVYDKIIHVEGSSEGEFSAPINDLELDKVYYVRAYIKNEKIGITHYSENQTEVELTTTPPILEMLSIDEKSYSGKRAKFVGNITHSGDPTYEKKGFVYGFNSNPTFENDNYKIIDGEGIGVFSINVADLIIGEQYYVRAFAEQNGKLFYSRELSFILQPVPVEIGELTVSEIGINTSKLKSSISNIGDPTYTEKGFIYNVEGNPDLYNRIERVLVNGDGSGSFEARISNLSSNTTYYVRAYAIQNNNVYYSEEESFTTAKIPAAVNTNDASNILFTTATMNATITNIGDPVYSHRGFYYSTSSNPTSSNSTTYIEDGGFFGDYYKELTGLEEKTTYYYRAFLVQPGETTPILGNVKSFKTGHSPNVTTGGVINVSCTGTEEATLNWSATLYGGLSDEGNPAFTEFGFVYGTTSWPKVDDGHSIYTTTTTHELQSGTKIFSKVASGFITGTTYYIRAVAKTPLGFVYGEPVVFTPAVIHPSVRTYDAKCYYVNNSIAWGVELYGLATTSSQPPITSLGFVYGTNNNPIVGDGASISVTYNQIEKQGDYYVYGSAVSGLVAGKIYYVRTYAKTAVGYTYGDVLSFRTY